MIEKLASRACLMSLEGEGRTSTEIERRGRRIEAAARALHAWHSTGQWEAAPATQREQFRQQALWALRAADTVERELDGKLPGAS